MKPKTLSSGQERFRAEPLGPEGSTPIGPPWVLKGKRSIRSHVDPTASERAVQGQELCEYSEGKRRREQSGQAAWKRQT